MFVTVEALRRALCNKLNLICGSCQPGLRLFLFMHNNWDAQAQKVTSVLLHSKSYHSSYILQKKKTHMSHGGMFTAFQMVNLRLYIASV